MFDNFQKGDLIQVLKKNASGIWLGRLENKIGSFKFINVELLSDETPSPGIQEGSGMLHLTRQSPWSSGDGMSMVENLLTSLHLQVCIVFTLRGDTICLVPVVVMPSYSCRHSFFLTITSLDLFNN